MLWILVCFSKDFPEISHTLSFFYVTKSFQTWLIWQNHIQSSIFHHSKMNHRKFVFILQCLKCFCNIEKIIDWQNSRKTYKNKTLAPIHMKYITHTGAYNFMSNRFKFNFLAFSTYKGIHYWEDIGKYIHRKIKYKNALLMSSKFDGVIILFSSFMSVSCLLNPLRASINYVDRISRIFDSPHHFVDNFST